MRVFGGKKTWDDNTERIVWEVEMNLVYNRNKIMNRRKERLRERKSVVEEQVLPDGLNFC